MQQLTPTSSTKALYRFDAAALTTDTSGNAHTLTAISDPAAGTGVFGGGVDLDGNDAYSSADHADFKPTGAFTVGGWIKGTLSANGVVFQSYSNAASKVAGFQLIITAAGQVYFLSGKNTGAVLNTDFAQIVGNTAIDDNAWHRVIAVWDGSYLRIYADGESDAAAVAWANAPAYNATNYIRVGCGNDSGTNNGFFVGSLDDVFLENRAWSGNEVAADYFGSFFQMF